MSVFYMPVKVFDEKEAVRNHAEDLGRMGSRALIVTGRRSAVSCGAYQDVCDALDQAGVSHVLFDQVEENPSVETIMKARDYGVSEGVDFVIGIGGGSPLDAAKAIALMIRKADKPSSYLYHPDGDSSALPVAAVPTTCGTGSEVTAVSVLTDPARALKKSIPHKLFPQIALIDGKYLKSAPMSVIANTAFDALTHLYESWFNTKAGVYSRMCVEEGLKIWAMSLPVLRGSREADDRDRANMMRAAMLGGMAIAHTGTAIPHALSYALTYELQVRHGKATAYFIAGYLSFADAKQRERMLSLAGFDSLEDLRKVYRFCCGEIGCTEEEIRRVLEPKIEENCANPVRLALSPYPVDEEKLRRIAYYELEHVLPV